MKEFRFDYINWYTILKDTIRNLWIIILAAVTGFLGVRAYFNFTYKPTYQSSATVSISAASSGLYTYSNLSKTISAASTFQEMFQSTYFRERLADITGLSVNGELTANQISETNLIVMTYVCSEPVEAFDTLNAVIANYNEITEYEFEDMIINVIIQPTVPTSPNNPISYGYYDKLAAIILSALVLAVIFISSYMRDTVKNESDVNSMLDAKLFSVVYHEEKNKTLKAKLRFVHSKEPLMITNILTNYRFAETFRIAALKLEYLMNSKKIKTVMITSCGENEGKTTVAVNLALATAALGKKTLLVDGDLRKPAVYKFFGGDDPDALKGFGEVLNGSISINEAITKESDAGLYVLCGKQKYKNSSEMFSTKRFERLIDSLKEQFDMVIIDTPPTSLVADAEIIAQTIEAAFIVVRQDTAPVPEINDMTEELNQSGTHVEGCIFNDVHVLAIGAENRNYAEYDAEPESEVLN